MSSRLHIAPPEGLRAGSRGRASLARRAALLAAVLWYGLGASGGGLETLVRAALGPSPARGFPCSTHECACRTAEGCLTRCCCSGSPAGAPAAPAEARAVLSERCSGGAGGESLAGPLHLGAHLPFAPADRVETAPRSPLALGEAPRPASAAPRAREKVPPTPRTFPTAIA